MSRNSLAYFFSFGLLSLLASGCGSDAPQPSNSSSPTPSASAAAPAPAAQPVAIASPAFSQPLVATPAIDKNGKPLATNARMDIAAGLIPATDPEVATKAVSKGRTDPFAAVIAQPVMPRAPLQQISRAVPSQPVAPENNTPRLSIGQSPIGKLSKVGANLGAASIAEMAKKAAASNSKLAIVPKAIVPLAPMKTALLTPPSVAPAIEPELSKAIQVSGIADINGQTQVIVKLPGESFSRYISVGERVLNGKVLIKRVQDRTALVPIVVLEEVGVEVYRRVGEKPLVAGKDDPAAPK